MKTQMMTMKHPGLTPGSELKLTWEKNVQGNERLQGWMKGTESSTPPNSEANRKSTLSSLLPAELQVVNGPDRTTHETLHERHVMRLAQLPIPFV